MDARQEDNHDWLDDEIYIPDRPANTTAHTSIQAAALPISACVVAQAKGVATQRPGVSAAHAAGDSTISRAPMPHKSHLSYFPGFIARSAMFRVTRKNEILDSATQINVAGGSMWIRGPLLCMRDKAVWEAAIQIAKERADDVGESFEIELRDFARRMGLSDRSGKALDSIWASLERLALVRVGFEIDSEKSKGIGSLLASAIKTEKRAYLRLNPDFALPALLGGKQFRFNTARRNALASSLAQWLHDYYTTHKTSRDLDLRYLRGLCGYDGVTRNFPAKLREAMEELAMAAPGLIAAYSIIQTSRSSDDWKLSVALGAEKPLYLPGKPVSHNGSGKKNGGVEL